MFFPFHRISNFFAISYKIKVMKSLNFGLKKKTLKKFYFQKYFKIPHFSFVFFGLWGRSKFCCLKIFVVYGGLIWRGSYLKCALFDGRRYSNISLRLSDYPADDALIWQSTPPRPRVQNYISLISTTFYKFSEKPYKCQIKNFVET